MATRRMTTSRINSSKIMMSVVSSFSTFPFILKPLLSCGVTPSYSMGAQVGRADAQTGQVKRDMRLVAADLAIFEKLKILITKENVTTG
jgi:hypothetical protein